jgi:hypothetical protein
MAKIQTDKANVTEMRSKDRKEAEELDEDKVEVLVLTLTEALKAISTVNHFYKATVGYSKEKVANYGH